MTIRGSTIWRVDDASLFVTTLHEYPEPNILVYCFFLMQGEGLDLELVPGKSCELV